MTNSAAWLDAAGKSLRIGDAPDWPVGSDEVKIQNRAVAINPADAYLSSSGMFIKQFPAILGYDIAGEIVKVGSSVTGFKVGDRVAGNCMGDFSLDGGPANGGFQQFTVLKATHIFPLSDWSYAEGAVLPCGMATAAAALLSKTALNLDSPAYPAKVSNGKILVIWGGASSVGVSAIAIAVHAGYEVITTASEKNFAFVKSLGVKHVFDYKSPSAVEDVYNLLNSRKADYVGAFSVVQGGEENYPAIIAGKLGIQNSLVISANPRVDTKDFPANVKCSGIALMQIYDEPTWPGFETDGSIAKKIFGEWLPAAVKGHSKVAPPPTIVGEGLGSLQTALEQMGKGVSATKLVVTL